MEATKRSLSVLEDTDLTVYVAKLAGSKESQEAFIRKMKQSNKNKVLGEIEATNIGLKEIEKRSVRQKAAYDSGLTSLKEYKEDIIRNEAEKADLSQKLEIKKVELAEEAKIENQSRKTLLALGNFKKVWGIADFHQKKELLHSILERVVVNTNKIELFFQNSI